MLAYPPLAWREAFRLLRRDTFDVVNAHFAIPTGPASLPVARLAGLPHVLSIHGGDIYDPSKRLSPHRWTILRRVVSVVLSASNEVVAQSENTRANAYEYYSYDGEICLIPLGVRIPVRPVVSRRSLRLPEDRFILIAVGRLVPRKGIDRLLRIMRHFVSMPIHLLVVGAGPELEPLKRLSHEIGVAEQVEFTGWVSDERKWELLRVADAYVSTSLHEGFGLVFIEAMAMGLPVVALDHGGQMDFLKSGETGFVAPAGDDSAVIQAISSLMSRPVEARRMGEENITRAENYRAERCANRYEELFERVIDASRGSRTTIQARRS